MVARLHYCVDSLCEADNAIVVFPSPSVNVVQLGHLAVYLQFLQQNLPLSKSSIFDRVLSSLIAVVADHTQNDSASSQFIESLQSIFSWKFTLFSSCQHLLVAQLTINLEGEFVFWILLDVAHSDVDLQYVALVAVVLELDFYAVWLEEGLMLGLTYDRNAGFVDWACPMNGLELCFCNLWTIDQSRLQG